MRGCYATAQEFSKIHFPEPENVGCPSGHHAQLPHPEQLQQHRDVRWLGWGCAALACL